MPEGAAARTFGRIETLLCYQFACYLERYFSVSWLVGSGPGHLAKQGRSKERRHGGRAC